MSLQAKIVIVFDASIAASINVCGYVRTFVIAVISSIPIFLYLVLHGRVLGTGQDKFREIIGVDNKTRVLEARPFFLIVYLLIVLQASAALPLPVVLFLLLSSLYIFWHLWPIYVLAYFFYQFGFLRNNGYPPLSLSRYLIEVSGYVY